MRVLIVHNRYREPGGEDRVVALESALLARHGHTVISYIEDNAQLDSLPSPVVAARTIWSHAAYRRVAEVIARERIDLVHVHNTLPLVSPSVYYAAHAAGIPVVQTLHNYRLVCPNALCFRDERPCVDCVGRTALPALAHGCYRDSRAATAAIAAMLFVHKTAGTWQRMVDTFIAPSHFARDMFVRGGLDPRRIVVKPHFVDPDPGVGSGSGAYAVFVGRLSKEKGVEVLLDAWSRLKHAVPLVIVGDGPLASRVAAEAGRTKGVRWLGRRQPSQVQRLMAEASFLVFPSLAYETFGQVIGEAFASGTPVVAAMGGAAAELVNDKENGLLVRPGDPDDLAASIDSLVAQPQQLVRMRRASRLTYQARFTADGNYRQLASIYANTLAGRRQAALSA
jgi:glycosyltransferase involved in cell wall biosynthesis